MSDCAIVCGLRLETAICFADTYAEKLQKFGERAAQISLIFSVNSWRDLASAELSDDLREQIETLILAGKSFGKIQFFQDYFGTVIVRAIRWGY